jgi:hypothetical protein
MASSGASWSGVPIAGSVQAQAAARPLVVAGGTCVDGGGVAPVRAISCTVAR